MPLLRQSQGALNIGPVKCVVMLLLVFFVSSVSFSVASAQTVNISGEISLPGTDVAPAGGLQFRIFAQSSASFDSESTTVTILEGANSVAYAIDVPRDSNNTLQLFYSCLSCSTAGGYYTTGNYSASVSGAVSDRNEDRTMLPGDVDSSNIDMTVLRSVTVAGTISLPEGALAPTGGFLVGIAVSRSDGSGARFQHFAVAEGQNSGNYVVQAATTIDDTVISYFCGFACGTYIYSGYYGELGTTAYRENATDLDNSSNQAGIDLELLAPGGVLSGTVNLPDSVVAEDGDIGYRVELDVYDENDELDLSFFLFITIADGESSAGYAFGYFPVPSGGSYELRARCDFNCDGFIATPIYLQDNGSLGSVYNRVDEFSLPAEQNFSLTKDLKSTVTGTISLPGGATADNGSIFNWVVMFRYDANGNYIDQFNNYVEIPNGASSVDYQIDYPTEIAGGSYAFVSYCESNCGDYLTARQYLQSDGSVSGQFTTSLGVDDIPGELDFELILGQKLIGTVTLPNSEVANSGDIEVFFQLDVSDAEGMYVDSFYANAIIPDGGSSVGFELNFLPAPVGGSYRLANRCITNCGDYLAYTSTYLQVDGSTSIAYVDALISQLPAQAEFELLKGDEISFSISLPSGVVAGSGDIGVYGYVETYNADGNYLASGSFNGVIANGGVSASSFVTYLPAPEGGSYQFVARCESNCGDLVQSDVFLQENGSSDFYNVKLPAAALPESANIVLIEGISVDIRTLLPIGVTADSGMQSAYTGVSVALYSGDGEFYTEVYTYPSYNLAAVASDYSTVVVPELDEGDNYQITYFCYDSYSGDCGEILPGVHGFSSSGLATGSGHAEKLTVLPASVDLQFYRGAEFSIESIRPEGLPDLGNYVYVEVSIMSYDLNGVLLGQDTPLFFIDANESSRVGEFGLLAVPAGGYYQIDFNCTDRFVEFGSSDCSSYVESHPSYSYVIQADSIPAPIRFQLVELSMADSYENDNQAQFANVIKSNARQTHTIHEAGDVDWVKFSLDEPSDVSIEVLSQGIDGAARVTLYEDDATTAIEASGDIVEADEMSNLQLSLINRSMLAAGDYFILVEGFSNTSTSAGYTLLYKGPDDDFCFTLVTQSGAVASMCL